VPSLQDRLLAQEAQYQKETASEAKPLLNRFVFIWDSNEKPLGRNGQGAFRFFGIADLEATDGHSSFPGAEWGLHSW
jgi:hypothetical protein